MKFPMDDYLKRLHYSGSLDHDESTLYELHRQQCFNIPFDMLDPHLGIEPDLSPEFIFKKTIYSKRGGGCSQINELFGLALTELGFGVERLMGRIRYGVPPETLSALSHKLLLVRMQDKAWVCDTGFGSNGIVEPIPFELNKVNVQSHGKFRILEDSKFGYKLQMYINDVWESLYAFNLNVFFPEDFAATNFYNSKSPNKIFVKNTIITMPTKNGRLILNNRLLKERKNGKSVDIHINDVKQYHEVLNNKFNIYLPEHPNFFPDTD